MDISSNTRMPRRKYSHSAWLVLTKQWVSQQESQEINDSLSHLARKKSAWRVCASSNYFLISILLIQSWFGRGKWTEITKMREDERGKESYVILATLWLCSPITASLCISHRIKQWGMWHTPADRRSAKTMAVNTRLKRHSQGLVFWVMFLRAVEKEEPIQSHIISAEFFTWVITQEKLF